MSPPESNPRTTIFDLGPQRPFEGDPNSVEAARQLKGCEAERAAWLSESGGAVEMNAFVVDARRMMQRDPRRYVGNLPDGVTVGQKSGFNRVVVH
jgi:hypothetical protein